jgi:hypothetical protein
VAVNGTGALGVGPVHISDVIDQLTKIQKVNGDLRAMSYILLFQQSSGVTVLSFADVALQSEISEISE